MRLARLFAALFVAAAPLAASAALATGCSGGTTDTPGTGGAPTQTDATSSSTSTSSGTPPSDCPELPESLDAGVPDGWVLDVTPSADDSALCTALTAQSTRCNPGCPMVDHTTCELDWACSRRLLRPDMIDDLYACMPTLSCAESGDLIGACAAKLRGKYPPTAAQLAYEQVVQTCSTGTSSCADGSCGGLSDAVYENLASCAQSDSDCTSIAFCMILTADLEPLFACYDSGQGDGGVGDGGELDGGQPEDGGESDGG